MDRKNRGPFMRASGWSAVIRYAMLLFILAGTAWAFSTRFEKRLADINATNTIADDLRLLTPEERARLQALSDLYKADFGIRLRLKISNTDIRPPEQLDGRTLFLGASPGGNEAIFVLPHLAKKALPDIALKEEEKNLKACMKRQAPGACLEKTLRALYSYLRD